MLQSVISYNGFVDDLRTIDLFAPNDHLINDSLNLWVVYIHGGAWRDPKHDSKDGHALIHFLLNEPYLQTKIVYASVNYRLSPQVTHPEHLNDIDNAIKFLRKTYNLKRCILIGHSAGATLAIQYFMLNSETQNIVHAIICVEGIYDLVELVNEYPSYEDFVKLAFGEDQKKWVVASPSYLISKHIYSPKCEIVLIQSEEDELLSMKQLDIMIRAFFRNQNHSIKFKLKKTKGKHFDVIKNKDFFDIVKEIIEYYK